MTNEEAIKVLECGDKIYIPSNMRLCKPEQLCEAMAIGVEALEKQIPQKPIYDYYEGHIGKKCICGGQVWSHQKHCENCGQSLLWEDDDD